MTIPFAEIKHIAWGDEAANENLKANEIIDFIARDFEAVTPSMRYHIQTATVKQHSFKGSKKNLPKRQYE